MTDKPKQETAVTQLAPRRMQLAEHAFQTWHVTPEAGTPVEALLDPKYFANCLHQWPMQTGHRIVCDAEDGSYTVTLFVREVGRMYVKTALLSKVELGAMQEPAGLEFEDYLVKWRGPIKKWAITRIADNKEVQDGLGTRDAAAEWVKQHLKALAA